MLDFFNIPDTTQNTSIFYVNANSNVSESAWQIWNKPQGCSFVHMIAIGGGGGGAGGGSSTNLAQIKYGGKGGGSSAVSIALFPAWTLPDILYIQVGMGGIGGAPIASHLTGTGTNGNLTNISIYPSSSAEYIVLKSGNNAAAAGGGTYNTGGTAGTIFTPTYLTDLGFLTTTVGVAGGNGGVSTVSSGIGVSVTPSLITCGGAGGGGATNTIQGNGGSINSTSITQASAGGTATVIKGENGLFNSIFSTTKTTNLPPIFTGGAGGKGINTNPAGDGGNGSYGSGGGGGGAGLGTPPAGGRGGNGGDGIVVITSF